MTTSDSDSASQPQTPPAAAPAKISLPTKPTLPTKPSLPTKPVASDSAPPAPAAVSPPTAASTDGAAADEKSQRIKIGSQRDDYRPGPAARVETGALAVERPQGNRPPRAGGGPGGNAPGGPASGGAASGGAGGHLTRVPSERDSSPRGGRGSSTGAGNGGAGGGGPSTSRDPSGGKDHQRGTRGRGGRGRDDGDAPRRDDNAPQYDLPRSKVALPNRREKAEDLEADLAAAFGEQSMDALIAPDLAATKQDRFERETKLQGKVVKVHRDQIFVDLPSRAQGVLGIRSFGETLPEPGSTIDVVVARYNEDEGLYQLNVPGEAIDSADWASLQKGSLVEARVASVNKGGLECMVGSIRAFMPAGQVSTYRIEDFGPLVGEKFTCLVTECKPEQRNLVLSRKAVMEREKKAAEEKIKAELAEGQVREGTVRSIKDFGAFVDLGGIDGLLHIGQMSWARIKHPSEILTIGQKIKVTILKIEPETFKINLSFRDLAGDPWKEVARNFPEGTLLQGKVTRVADFGAFVELEAGVEGLIHVSELDFSRVFRVSDLVKPGDVVDVKVLGVDLEKRRISLSRKQALQKPGSASFKDEPEDEEEESLPPPPPSNRKTPLKGGTGEAGKSGEGGLGLKL